MHRVFAVIWIATVVSNIGQWLQNAAGGWLMTSLNPNPTIVALVQVAGSLPMFLLGLPAGAMADIFNRRRLLLSMETTGTLLTALFALLVTLDRASPAALLVFTCLAGLAAATAGPAWDAIVPQLVGHKDLAPAIALNSAGVNISRAIGPALAGVIIAYWGLAAPFWINAVANLGVIGALYWWHAAKGPPAALPPERLGGAIRVGLRYARHNRTLRATLVRTSGFIIFASAYWALLPLVAREQMGGSPQLYGLLLGAIGTGALVGAFALPRIRARFAASQLIAFGSAGTALALLLFGLAHQPAVGLAASLLAGLSWITVLATLNVSAQRAVPEWVRGRGLAVYATVLFGAVTVGSLLWGQVATWSHLSTAMFLAAAGLVLTIPLLRRWKLQTGSGPDLTPSMHWPEPVLCDDIDYDRGPVLVTVEYQIAPADREAFLSALSHVAAERRRDGAYEWGVFEDAAGEGHWIETFLSDSWLEHLRQHERVTKADRAREEAVLRFQAKGAPKITHYIAPKD